MAEAAGNHRQDQADPDTSEDNQFWDDDDSAIGSISNYESSTTSLTSSVARAVEEYGRTYHSYKSGKYTLPNDEKEQDRLDLQHAILTRLIGNKLSRAPLHKIAIHNVLDVATGTGIWAIEFAEAHREAHVIGTDLSPIQPPYVPPNCSFEVDDAEDEWIFKQAFSYIHCRATVICFKDVQHVIRSAYNCLAPGGYLEFQDPTFPLDFADPQPPPNSPHVRWLQLMSEGAAKAGRPLTKPSSYKEWFERAGFIDVREEKFVLPTGPWSEDQELKTIGTWQLVNWLEVIDALTPRLLGALGWGIDEIRVFAAQVKEDVKNGNAKPYSMFWCVYGRKPELKGGDDGISGADDAV